MPREILGSDLWYVMWPDSPYSMGSLLGRGALLCFLIGHHHRATDWTEMEPTQSVRTAELIASLSLAADLGIGVPLEHGLQSTLIAMRLCERLGLDETARLQSYYMCLLFYVGCTTNDISPEVFGADNSLTTYGTPHRFGSPSRLALGVMRAVAPPTEPFSARALQLARGLPRLMLGYSHQVAAICEVARMLTDRLGLPESVSSLFGYEGARWDGLTWPGGVKGDDIPAPVRIVNVARDAGFQLLSYDADQVADLIRQRAGKGLDPAIARELAANSEEILHFDPGETMWDLILDLEPKPWLVLEGGEIDRALAAMGAFSDLASPYLVGHSAGVAQLATAAAKVAGMGPIDVTRVGRAAQVHDIGRVAIPVRIWEKPGPLSADDREQARLHPYHTERILSRSPFLSDLGSLAGLHHERLDGSGYHRGVPAPAIHTSARLLAAADAYHAMTEPRAHRGALPAAAAAEAMVDGARRGRLGADAVNAVLEAVGQGVARVERPAGLTEREVEVVSLLARSRQTKQVARALGISVKTADRHIQNAYKKMGVSTRSGATLFAMENGILAWGELPIDRLDSDS